LRWFRSSEPFEFPLKSPLRAGYDVPVGASVSPQKRLTAGSSGQDVEVEVNAIVASVDANEHREKTTIGVLHHDVTQGAKGRVLKISGKFFGNSSVCVVSGLVGFDRGKFDVLWHVVPLMRRLRQQRSRWCVCYEQQPTCSPSKLQRKTRSWNMSHGLCGQCFERQLVSFWFPLKDPKTFGA